MRAHDDDFRTCGTGRLGDFGCGMTKLYDELALDADRHLQCELLQHRLGAVSVGEQNALGRERHRGRQWQHMYQIEGTARFAREFGGQRKCWVRAVLLETYRISNLFEGHYLSPGSPTDLVRDLTGETA